MLPLDGVLWTCLLFIKKNVSKSLEKAAYDVRSVIRLVKVAGMLAADYFSFGPRNQLDFGFGMTNTEWKKMILKKKKQHKRNAKNNNNSPFF